MRFLLPLFVGGAAAEDVDPAVLLATRPTTTTTTTTSPPPVNPDLNPGFRADAMWQVVAPSASPDCDVSICSCPKDSSGRCVRLFESREEAHTCAQATACGQVQYLQVAHFNVCQVGKMYVVPIASTVGNDDDFWADSQDAFVYLPVVNTAFADSTIDIYTTRDDSNAVIGLSAGGTSCAVNDADYERDDDGVARAQIQTSNRTSLVIEINSLLKTTYLGHNHNMLFIRRSESNGLVPPVMVGGYQGFLAIVKEEPDTFFVEETTSSETTPSEACECGALHRFLSIFVTTSLFLYISAFHF